MLRAASRPASLLLRGARPLAALRQASRLPSEPRQAAWGSWAQGSVSFTSDLMLRRFSHGAARCQPRSAAQQLSALRDLLIDAGSSNSKASKLAAIRARPELKDLLQWIYHPYHRTYLTSRVLLSWIESGRAQETQKNGEGASLSSNHDPKSLEELFEMLAQRKLTGNAALHVVTRFLEQEGILDGDTRASGPDGMTLLEVFCKCLDRNLRAGLAAKTIESAWEEAESVEETSSRSAQDASSPDASFSRFEVALGKSMEPEELLKILPTDPEESSKSAAWFASRKLDGVRCIILLDFATPLPPLETPKGRKAKVSPSQPPVLLNIRTLSRSGHEFTTLGVLCAELSEVLPASPKVLDMLHRASQAGPIAGPGGQGIVRIVLDGEVCVLRRSDGGSGSEPTPEQAEEGIDIAGGNEDAFMEDFQGIVGLVRRKAPFQVPDPAFFPFDALTWSEFRDWRRPSASHEVLSQRLRRVEGIARFAQARGQGRIRRLEQEKVKCVGDVEVMLEKSYKQGWEGVMLRKDGLYEGKRSSSIRKLKRAQDAEYIVEGVETSLMRLPVGGGRFEERMALASAWIRHDGTPVAVGSGFSVPQRLRYGQDPNLLIGKTITVEFFQESRNASRDRAGAMGGFGGGGGVRKKAPPPTTDDAPPMDVPTTENKEEGKMKVNAESEGGGGGMSLRFPRLKLVWEEGGRDV